MSVIEDNWDFQFDLHSVENESFHEFQVKVDNVNERVVKLLEDGFKPQNINYNFINTQNHDGDELKNLIDKNKQLRQDIDVKLEDIAQRQSRYEHCKQDQKLLSQEIKETHEAFLMAKKYYKKYLKMYYTIESRSNEKQAIFIQFFTEYKKDSDHYSLSLSRDCNLGKYDLISITPKVPIFKEVQRRLKETNDLPGALYCIRQAFIHIRLSKNNK
ncbi:uncharacterized protein LOC131842597 [Achroia grisella]|uniref:uncharacterized protein LOC131842597 n=1 Tax=Achroia grisella TaxID=688607 RepID=UPI0027D22734|nr:uncharacterized protein LOC131842597 [Achroia grisella]